MKNFTNNFKQFTSRLSARWLIMALMMLVGTSSAWGKIIYLEVDDWWGNDGAWFDAWVWGSSQADNWYTATKPSGSDYYQIDVPDDATGMKLLRKDPNNKDHDWNKWNETGDLTISNDKNLYKTSGSWSTNKPASTGKLTASSTSVNTNTNVTLTPSLTSNQTINDIKSTTYAINPTSGASINGDTFTATAAGTYTITATITYNPKGFSSITSKVYPTVTITVENPCSISATITGAEYECYGSTIKLSGTLTEACGKDTYYGWQWKYKGDSDWNSKHIEGNYPNTTSHHTSTNSTTYSATWDIPQGGQGKTIIFRAYAYQSSFESDGTTQTVTTYVAPTVYDVAGNNNKVTLSSSQQNYTYTLYNGSNPVSNSSNPGTGDALEWTVSEDGTYTVKAKPTGSDCSEIAMSDSYEYVACTNPNFAIQASETVTKGEQITASITGEHTPLVTWSSSNEEVATIDAFGNITAIKFGQTTITATTTGKDEYCENVPQSATLTVKETPRVSITGENTICEGQTVTLTASITDLSDGNEPTINWYKEGEDDIKKTGATYLPVSTGKYYVIVTGDYINRKESGKFQFTVNENPTIQSILDNNATNVEICGTGNETTLSVTEGLASYSWGDGNTKTVNETGTYTVTATDANGCTSNEVKFNVKVLNPTVEFVGDNEQTVCPGATANFEVVLAQGQSVSWKDADGAEVSTSNPFTQIIEGEAGTTYTYKVVISEGSCSSAEGTVTATIPAINLTVGSISGDNEICSGNATTLTLTGMVNGTVEKWLKSTDNNNYSDVSNTTTTLNTGNLTTSTYYKALVSSSVCPNHKEPTEAYLVTVNPLPTISISGSESAVLYEDVTLTATGTNINEVNWTITNGTGELSNTTGTSVKLTSSTAGTVKIKATATSENSCTKESNELSVVFGAENCTPVPSNDIKITFTHPAKNNNNASCQYWGFGYIFKDGVTPNNDRTNYLAVFPDKDQTSGSKTVTLSNVQTAEIKVYLNGYYEYSGCRASTQVFTLQRGGIYSITISSDQQGNGNWEKVPSVTKTGSLTRDPEITAPAVKTVSVTSDEDGNVTMVGQVVKTGCDTQAILGLQYKKQNPDGTTYEANYTTYPNPGTKEAISAGKTFTVTTKLEDGTYLVRARIDNSHATNGYGEDIKVVVNTTKTPISNVKLNYCDENGGSVGVNPNPMCKGAIAYVKLSYVGSKYSDIKWLVEGVETNLVTDEGDGVWSYEIQGNGSLSVELKNDANTDPAWPYSNKLPFTIIPEPTAPYISIDPASGIICQGSSATIKVENPSTDCSYKLVKEGSKADFTPYTSGDLIYKVQIEGKYYVVARHDACTDNEYTSNQVAINKIISTSAKISIEPANAETTPWEPVTITVKPDAGYIYELTYTDGNLAAVDGVRIKQNGDSYTYYIPRPWDTGDSNPVRTPINYGIKAQLKVDGEASQCQLNADTATIQLKDEDNENCPK